MRLADSSIPPVYVPYEAVYRKDERTGKDVLDGWGPGAHITRILTEGGMYTNGPDGLVPEQNVELAATENALRAELDQKNAQIEAMMTELIAIREKMEKDPGVPAKKTR